MNAIIQHFQDELSAEERALFEANARLHGRRPGEHLKALIFGPRGSGRAGAGRQPAACLPGTERTEPTERMPRPRPTPAQTHPQTQTLTGAALRGGLTAVVMVSACAAVPTLAPVPVASSGGTSMTPGTSTLSSGGRRPAPWQGPAPLPCVGTSSSSPSAMTMTMRTTTTTTTCASASASVAATLFPQEGGAL